eukprot:GEMP01050693.1.p1 GENE.GEMP01050693.1~~GEMP01050693.1.p1  ORF type:complete len:439 (+),score=62.94 GEMP01050693.1:129-1445(+)
MVVKMIQQNVAVIVLIVFGLTLIFANFRSSEDDDKYILLSRHVYEELLEAVKNPVIYPATADTSVHEVPKEAEQKRLCDDSTSACTGFANPQFRDVPGTGDVFNGQVATLDECAQRCYRTPSCSSFEYSPTAPATAMVKNCQMASKIGPLGNAYLDFKLYIKNREISKPLARLRGKDKPQVNAAAPAPVEASQCKGMINVSYGIESRMQPQAAALRQALQDTHYPSYDQMYKLIENRPYLPEDNMWTNFLNPFGMQPNFVFPFSNLQPDALDQILQLLGRTPRFAVEVGSFHGHSAILQAKIFKQKFPDNPPYLLCIDPFIGDLGMLLFRDDWEKITPGEIRNGRSTSYWQFMLNVNNTINAGAIGPKQILPLVTSSVVSARYFSRLAPGGILFGDDFSWEGVGNDVTKFANDNGLEIHQHGATWAIKKSANPFPSSH